MEKSFYKGTQRYSFQYEPMPATNSTDLNEINSVNASSYTFDDEEQVRTHYYYPYIKSGDVVFDIGASFGSYTLPALALGAHVLVFSPEHEYDLIHKNIKINGFERFTLFTVGLYSKEGYFKTDTTEFSEEDRTPENQGQRTGWWIAVRTLDSLVNTNFPLGRIDFLKIDTEGAELEVLKGGIETIRKYKPKILLELHLFKDEKMEEKLKEFLKSLALEYKWKVQPYTKSVSHMFAWI